MTNTKHENQRQKHKMCKTKNLISFILIIDENMNVK
jgi:hypothetical protein